MRILPIPVGAKLAGSAVARSPVAKTAELQNDADARVPFQGMK